MIEETVTPADADLDEAADEEVGPGWLAWVFVLEWVLVLEGVMAFCGQLYRHTHTLSLSLSLSLSHRVQVEKVLFEVTKGASNAWLL
jgi:hypothetical protein